MTKHSILKADHQVKVYLDIRCRAIYCLPMKRTLLLFTLVAAMLTLVSCGRNRSTATTIQWWQFWTDTGIKPTIQDMVREFEATHPHIKVELVDLTWAEGHDKIAIAFSSGSGPDVVELGSDWISEFSSSGHLSDMTLAVDSNRKDFLMWEPGMYKSQIYSFPWILGTRVLFMNRDLLFRAGFGPDFSPADWNELLNASQQIRKLGSDIYGFGSNAAEKHRLYKKFLPFLWANGGEILSAEGTSCLLDAPPAVAALEYYIELCKSGLTDTQRRLEDAFLDGKVGFVISGDWLLKRIEQEKPQLPFATGLIPGPRPNSTASFAGGEYLAINAASTHKEAALELIRFICSPENQLRFCRVNRTANPSSVKAASDSLFRSQPHFDTFIRQMEKSKSTPVHPRWVYIEAELEKGIENALYGDKTPREALTEAKTKIEALLAQ
jgi:multiple sugar transport system substrate-binding protein